ncbi:MAG: hypothetical protein GQ541_01095 [Desulfovibrionaceae bacterium]|nr:hypothetical protein [Desulfovibrionaceae bacterium]
MGPKAVQIATPKNIPVPMTETEDDLHRWSAIYFATQVTCPSQKLTRGKYVVTHHPLCSD